MSLISSRVALIHVATVQRDSNAGVVTNGIQQAPSWSDHLTNLACRAWTTTGREVLDPTTSVIVEDMRVIVPLGTDVNEQDRITGVVDHEGNSVISGNVGIRAVITRKDHLELILVRIS